MDSVNVEASGTQLGHILNIRQTVYSRNASFDKWTSRGTDNVLTLSMHLRREAQDEDDEALKWAALERLPTFDRLRTSIRKKCEGGRVVTEHIDVRKMDLIERQMLMESLVKDADEDNEMFLRRLRNRIDNVQIKLPTVEVRFENLTVDAKCHVGERALPSLWIVTKNFAESLLAKLHLTSRKQRSLTILKGVSGIIRPCRMTLLLGPPGSGKTTLLLALAGKLDTTLKKRGSITYNGHALHEFVPQKTSAYISQDDLHIGEMTVRETLDFSALSQGVGSRYDMIAELVRREKESQIIPDMEIDAYMKATSLEGLNNSLQTDYTLKILGLDTCADTIIGNPMRRGVSGGQRKRVTTGEMIVGPTKTLFMDEISNGLDSSTTFHVVKSLQQFVHVFEGTILMSLLQPQPETYELFDDVVLLSEGQIVYHGPRENALDFFESCGFKCPSRKNVADFLQEVVSYKDQKQYWANSMKHYKYVSALAFAEKFQQSSIGINLVNELAQPYPKERNHRAALAFHRYTTKKMQLLQASFAREWILMKRNSFIYIVKAIQLVIVAFVTMTVFLRTRLQADLQDGNYYMGALFFSLLVITFNGFSEISLTIMRLPVFFKQRDLFFYPAWAYTLPTFIMQIPQAIVESGLWVSITYFLIGFAPQPSRFFKQYLLLFLTHQMSSSIFRLIGGVCQTMDLANTGGSIVLLLIFMLGGFIIPKGRIPKWWIWGYWFSPLAYAEAAITVNEFLAPQWNTTVDKSTIATTGMSILLERGFPIKSYYYWFGIGALIGFILIFNLLLTMALSHFPAPSRSKHTISKETLDGMQVDEDELEVSLLKPAQKNPLCKGLSEPISPFELQMHYMENGTKSFHKYRPVGCQNAKGSAGLSLPFNPLSISFENLQYLAQSGI